MSILPISKHPKFEGRLPPKRRGRGATYARDALVLENLARRTDDPVKALLYRAQAEALRAKIPQGRPKVSDVDDHLEAALRRSLER
jgi:hypothetical protein